MASGQAVLVITEPLGGGEPQYALYYVAEQDPAKAESIMTAIAAPNERIKLLGPVPEAVIKTFGLQPREFKRA